MNAFSKNSTITRSFSGFFYEKNEFKTLDLTLNRIISAVADTGFNEDSLGFAIHIAGTNGKGSTAHYLAQMFEMSGFNVGLYTSPHITDITERIRFNSQNIPADTFEKFFNESKNLIHTYSLTFFEALTLIAFRYFAKQKPDFTVIETGLGGTYDATNIISKKLPVITTISKDHSAYLGENIYEIINEKLGICRDNREIFIGANKPFVYEYIENVLKGKTIHKVKPIFDSYNANNLNLASTVFTHLTGKTPPACETLTAPPCRMEKIGKFTLDGGHNVSAILSLTKSPEKYDAIIFSCTKDRNPETMLKLLKKKTDTIFLTEIPDNDRSIKITEIDINGISKLKEPRKLIKELIKDTGTRNVLITGSLYFCAYCRTILEDMF